MEAEPTQETKPPAPVVFMSYSHDSTEHQMWVAGLARDLRQHGVDAVLDQWHLRPGMDVPGFMESGIRNANRVCLVCTPEYARKAEGAMGGVGYEKMIVTGELYANLGSTKFIPIVAVGEDGEALPSFLRGRLYVDFRDVSSYEHKLEELLREIHDVPANLAPPLGQNPFQAASVSNAPMPIVRTTGTAQRTTEPLPPVKGASKWSSEKVYDTCQKLLRQNDLVGWRTLAKELRGSLDDRLAGWLKDVGKREFKTLDEFVPAADAALGIVMPLMVQALAGVESTLEAFSDQRSLVDDFLSLSKWPTGGLNVVIELPESLVYVYQYMHGAVALFAQRPDLALALGTMQVGTRRGESEPLWRQHGMVGWPRSLGRSYPGAFEYLLKFPETRPWLRKVFVRDGEWELYLRGYNALLSTLELATRLKIAGNKVITFDDSEVHYGIPPMFLLCEDRMRDRVLSLAFRDSTVTEAVAQQAGISPAKLRDHWEAWAHSLHRSLEKHFCMSTFSSPSPLP